MSCHSKVASRIEAALGISARKLDTRYEVMVSTSSHLGFLPSARLTQAAGVAELMTPLTPRPSSVSEAAALGRGMVVGIAAAEDPAMGSRLAEFEALQDVARRGLHRDLDRAGHVARVGRQVDDLHGKCFARGGPSAHSNCARRRLARSGEQQAGLLDVAEQLVLGEDAVEEFGGEPVFQPSKESRSTCRAISKT